MPCGSLDDIATVSALEDPVRRALYSHIAAASGAVSREEAGRAARISRALAAYHLDRLVGVGLLDVEYRRPPGRGGPGAGRPTKLYRRSRHLVQVCLPARNYELVATLLAAAADPNGVGKPDSAHTELARATGTGIGLRARARSGARTSKRRLLAGIEAELDAEGFEPASSGGTITLRNCPFDSIARSHPGLMCGMNVALMAGVVDALGLDGLSATLDPGPGRCCVVLRTSPSPDGSR